MQTTLEASAALAGVTTAVLEVSAKLGAALTNDESFDLLMELLKILKRLKKYE